ncbi:MAG: hypothetical protein RQ756_09510, partial [Flavobacteriaceae bacterium]|nr:hypothetical protein [Flavobacteriaceae bacterium]
CSVYQFTQSKSAQVLGQVRIVDNHSQQLLDTYPLESTFVFEHAYGRYTGDKRALDDNLLGITRRRAVPFPTNEQMIYDTGEDLKAKLKTILNRLKLRA